MKLGAMIGTMILPGIGTAVGSAIGGLGGYLVGEYAGGGIVDTLTSDDQTPQGRQPRGRTHCQR